MDSVFQSGIDVIDGKTALTEVMSWDVVSAKYINISNLRPATNNIIPYFSQITFDVFIFYSPIQLLIL